MLSLVGVLLVASAHGNINICCVVRTFVGHKDNLLVLLSSLTDASRHARNIDINFFIVDTDPMRSTGTFFIERTILHLRQHYGNDIYQHLHFANRTYRPDITWGYDATDDALGYILTGSLPCDYFLFTNGDNYYSHYLFTELESALAKAFDLVAFNYIHRYEPIFVKLQHSSIDLGAAFVSERAVRRSNARFLPQNLSTPDIIARDWYFFEHVLSQRGATSTIVRKTLFIHI